MSQEPSKLDFGAAADRMAAKRYGGLEAQDFWWNDQELLGLALVYLLGSLLFAFMFWLIQRTGKGPSVMKWWGWLVLTVFSSVAWAGAVAVMHGIDQLDDPEMVAFGGISIIVATCIATPLVLAARR